MSEWQPIETAPKDGTEYLTYGRYPTNWSDEIRHIKKSTLKNPSLLRMQLKYATHWMPRPEPPKGESQ